MFSASQRADHRLGPNMSVPILRSLWSNANRTNVGSKTSGGSSEVDLTHWPSPQCFLRVSYKLNFKKWVASVSMHTIETKYISLPHIAPKACGVVQKEKPVPFHKQAAFGNIWCGPPCGQQLHTLVSVSARGSLWIEIKSISIELQKYRYDVPYFWVSKCSKMIKGST